MDDDLIDSALPTEPTFEVPEATELELMRLALESALDSVIVHTEDGHLLYFNDAAAESRGLTREQFAALPPWGWTPNATEPFRADRMNELKDRGSLFFMSSRTLPDGTDRVDEIHARYVRTPQGPVIVAVVRDATHRHRAEEALRALAFHDPLTGLANRTLLDDRLELAISSARRHNDLLGVAFLDIDRFKPVNDRHGHACGDQVLQVVAKRLSRTVRESDTVARVGGDEFVVVFPRLESKDDLWTAAEKLADSISQRIELGCADVEVSASVGIAWFDPATDDARSLLMKADLAMYDSKRTGGAIRSVETLDR